MFEIETLKHQEIDVSGAAERLRNIVQRTPLQRNANLSRKHQCQVFLKREDLQVVRSYKIRGAYNMMSNLPAESVSNGAVCASAGNHAQGFAYSCRALNVRGVIFMPNSTPRQKIVQTRMFGGENIEIVLTGDTYDDCAQAAIQYTQERGMSFVHPFDDLKIIEGQGTVGFEIWEDLKEIDYLIVPIGGGGLAAGVGTFIKSVSPNTRIIGVEPEGAPSMKEAFEAGHPVELTTMDRFVDGAAVKRVGDITYRICREVLDEVLLVPEGKICSSILKMYNKEAIVVEPAGALSIAALYFLGDRIKGKNVVCIVSGSNNDIDRMQEIKERSLQYEGFRHYFLINFPQRPGALKEFVNQVLGPDDDITRFEYIKKNMKEYGPALVGIELTNREDYPSLIRRMEERGINYTPLNKNDTLFGYLV
jgi:threonine dehydratase